MQAPAELLARIIPPPVRDLTHKYRVRVSRAKEAHKRHVAQQPTEELPTVEVTRPDPVSHALDTLLEPKLKIAPDDTLDEQGILRLIPEDKAQGTATRWMHVDDNTIRIMTPAVDGIRYTITYPANGKVQIRRYTEDGIQAALAKIAEKAPLYALLTQEETAPPLSVEEISAEIDGKLGTIFINLNNLFTTDSDMGELPQQRKQLINRVRQIYSQMAFPSPQSLTRKEEEAGKRFTLNLAEFQEIRGHALGVDAFMIRDNIAIFPVGEYIDNGKKSLCTGAFFRTELKDGSVQLGFLQLSSLTHQAALILISPDEGRVRVVQIPDYNPSDLQIGDTFNLSGAIGLIRHRLYAEGQEGQVRYLANTMPGNMARKLITSLDDLLAQKPQFGPNTNHNLRKAARNEISYAREELAMLQTSSVIRELSTLTSAQISHARETQGATDGPQDNVVMLTESSGVEKFARVSVDDKKLEIEIFSSHGSSISISRGTNGHLIFTLARGSLGGNYTFDHDALSSEAFEKGLDRLIDTLSELYKNNQIISTLLNKLKTQAGEFLLDISRVENAA